jgi:hypothetical protein
MRVGEKFRFARQNSTKKWKTGFIPAENTTFTRSKRAFYVLFKTRLGRRSAQHEHFRYDKTRLKRFE